MKNNAITVGMLEIQWNCPAIYAIITGILMVTKFLGKLLFGVKRVKCDYVRPVVSMTMEARQ
jgi:hypothetical protein